MNTANTTTAKKTTIVKFRMDIENIPASLQVMALTRPCEYIKYLTCESTHEEIAGMAGGHCYYKTLKFRKMFNPPWVYECTYDLEGLSHLMVYKQAFAKGDFAKMNDLFGPEVRVGDMLAIQDGHGIFWGFVCGEGHRWEKMLLADNTANVYEFETAICVGMEYAKIASKAVERHKAA